MTRSMTPPPRQPGMFAAAVLSSTAVLAASAWLLALDAAHPWPAGLAIAVIAAAWALRPRLGARPAQPSVDTAILLAALLLALALGAALWTRTGGLDGLVGELGERGRGAWAGLVVAVFANVIPKQAAGARRAGAQRIAGWAGVLGGALHALAWLALPLPMAGDAAVAALALAIVAAGAAIAWRSRT